MLLFIHKKYTYPAFHVKYSFVHTIFLAVCTKLIEDIKAILF